MLAWTWTSSGRSPVRVPGERHGVRLSLLVLRDGCGAGEFVFLDYPLTQRLRSSRSVRLSRGVSLRRPLKEFPVLGVHTLYAMEIWCIIPPRPCIWQSVPRYLGVACRVHGTLDSSGDDFVRVCMLGTTVDTGFASVLGFGRISHNFYVHVDSDPEVFFSFLRMET